MRGPGDEVYACAVQREGRDDAPSCGLFAPDQDAAVVGGGGEDGAEFGVGL